MVLLGASLVLLIASLHDIWDEAERGRWDEMTLEWNVVERALNVFFPWKPFCFHGEEGFGIVLLEMAQE